MPTISMFYGVLIKMFFHDTGKHHSPHIHAEYQGKLGVDAIEYARWISGNLPPKKHKLVVAWIEIYDNLNTDLDFPLMAKRKNKNEVPLCNGQ